jgi:hypothetical protein
MTFNYQSRSALFETLRSLAYTSISGTYAAVGTPLVNPSHGFRLINNTDGDMFFSIDGTNNHFFVPASSFVLYDISTNKDVDTPFYLGALTQFYVKQSSSPSKNSVYIETMYGL